MPKITQSQQSSL